MVRLCIGLARRLLSAPVPVRALSALAVLCACSGVIEWFSLRTLPHSTTRLCVIDASLRGNKGADAWLFLDLSTRSIAEIDLDLNGDRLVDRIIFVPTARLIYTLVDRTFDGRFDVQIEERHAGEQTQWIEKDLASAEYEVDGRAFDRQAAEWRNYFSTGDAPRPPRNIEASAFGPVVGSGGVLGCCENAATVDMLLRFRGGTQELDSISFDLNKDGQIDVVLKCVGNLAVTYIDTDGDGVADVRRLSPSAASSAAGAAGQALD
jgi:hypothetical protein